MRAASMGRPYNTRQVSCDTTSSTRERSPLSAWSMGRSSTTGHNSRCTSRSTPGRSKCGKGFCDSTRLIQPSIIHSGEKPYKCLKCGKVLYHKPYFNKHQRIHRGEKPCVCTESGKAFIYCSTFILHKRAHTGEKPYECKECGKTFSNQSGLSRHFTIHSEEKPYKGTVWESLQPQVIPHQPPADSQWREALQIRGVWEGLLVEHKPHSTLHQPYQREVL